MFHVVCHDCETEEILTDVDEAKNLVQRHAIAWDHDVEYGRIA